MSVCSVACDYEPATLLGAESGSTYTADFHLTAGELVHIPTAIYHSTINSGDELLKMIAIYAPFGPEAELRKMDGVHIETAQNG